MVKEGEMVARSTGTARTVRMAGTPTARGDAGWRLAALALVVVLASAGCMHRRMGSHHGFVDDRDVIQMVSSNVQGKNVYIPSTVVVPAHKSVTLSVYNTTDTPHGFAIPALGIQEVLMPGVETAIPLPAVKGHAIYDIGCHLHPPHRHATLVVVGH